MTSSFQRRYLSAVIQIGAGALDSVAPPNTYSVLTNHRIVAEVSADGGETQGRANIKIYGMNLNQINQLTTVGNLVAQIKNQNIITISAGDDPSAMSIIFAGTIYEAFGNFNSAPDVPVEIIAYSGMGAAGTLIPATSIKGGGDVALIMKTLAGKMGWKFINSDVNATLSNPYFYGSVLDQIKQCARAARIDYSIENGVLAIKTQYGSFDHYGTIPIITPTTGMVGYPATSSNGMFVKTLFNPNIHLGSQIEVAESAILPANGKWTVNKVLHELESIVPNGRWFTTCGVFANG